MPIIVDNTTIQECGGVKADNVNMELVQADSTTVYDELCFQGVWSGSTEALDANCYYCLNSYATIGGTGINTSGNQYRDVVTYGTGDCVLGGPIYSGWLASDSSGLDSGTVSVTVPTTGSLFYLNSTIDSMKIYWDNSTNTGVVSFDINNKFTGSCSAKYQMSGTVSGEDLLTTSGGQVRIENKTWCLEDPRSHNVGDWITLN